MSNLINKMDSIIDLLNKRNIEKKSILIERFNQKMLEIEALNELFADKNKRKFELLDSVIEGALASGTKTVISSCFAAPALKSVIDAGPI